MGGSVCPAQLVQNGIRQFLRAYPAAITARIRTDGYPRVGAHRSDTCYRMAERQRSGQSVGSSTWMSVPVPSVHITCME
jgi:hypothetical protein